MSPPSSTPTPPPFWRDLSERDHAIEPGRTDEFASGASSWPADLSRRDFMRLLGGTLALAGLSGCGAGPAGEIVPYVTGPDRPRPAEGEFYASSMDTEGYGRGILVKSHSGRPTKIEGNPDHPESLGATDAITQAAILSLYDPDRSRTPLRAGQPQAWTAFLSEWRDRHAQISARRGRGVALLTEPASSPTFLRLLHAVLDAWPEARWYQHTPLARHDLDGAQADYDFGTAEIVFSVGGDWFGQHPAALRYARSFAQRRRIESGRVALTRFHVIESTPSVTSTLADFRLPAAPARIRVVLDAIAHGLAGRDAHSPENLTPEESHFVRTVAGDLQAHGRNALCVAGPEQPEDIRRWARAMNVRLGSDERLQRLRSPVRSDGDPRSAGDLASLAAGAGEIDTLLILSANPVYTAPFDLGFAEVLQRVPWSLQLGSHLDETARRCTWHLPETHFLEAWGDSRGYDGTAALQQPLITSLLGGRSAIEVLALCHDPAGVEGYDLVRDTWRPAGDDASFEPAWFAALNRGVIGPELDRHRTAAATIPARSDVPQLDGPATADHATLLLQPDSNILDGRWANNPWLQELPRPLTRLVWDNAALISPALAAQLGVDTGDMIEISLPESSADARQAAGAGPTHQPATSTRAATGGRARHRLAACVLPGQATDCITVPLGYGRTDAGSSGTGRGFNGYQLRPSNALWAVANVSVRKVPGQYPLVGTQGHFTMENREVVRIVADDHLAVPPRPEQPSLYPAWPRGEYAWAMSIDLSTCTGCSACVVACQAENNIPTVGKEQVRRGREMLWLRVDRYYSGEPANPRSVVQPVPCMHCENAPCELVCPVGATVHSSEGLNDMVYNRCVGTRYCSNNCPYKVRRFNFLDFRAPAGSPVHLQQNPDVTVRSRGVMEKCTYCVQRIDAARIAAEKERRRIRDGEVRTACQQACPVEAIVFGDLNDPASRVNRRKRESLDYSLLEELNTRPRTTYLAKVVAADALAADAAAHTDIGARASRPAHEAQT